MKNQYNKTITACFAGYIVQAVVNNFTPLLFLFFQKSYHVPISQITLLVTFNFGIQLLVDLLSVRFIDKIGYRVSMPLQRQDYFFLQFYLKFYRFPLSEF